MIGKTNCLTCVRIPSIVILLLTIIFLSNSLCLPRKSLSADINLVPSVFLLTQNTRSASDINPFRILNSTSEQLLVQVSLPDLVIKPISRDDEFTYHLLFAGGAGSTGQVGYPRMPAFSRNILIPNGMDTNIIVTPGDPIIYTELMAYPLQDPIANLEDSLVPEFYKDETAYASSDDYPGNYAELLDDGVMRGQRMANLWVYPYQYNPSTSELRIYPNMQVSITFSGDIQPIEHRYKSKIFEKIYRELAINAGEILEAEKEAEVPPTDALFGPYGWDYLIFTRELFSAAATDLANWKKKMGFKPLVTIIPTNWTAMDVSAAIETAYHYWDLPPEYVLFIGDAEYIPTHYQTWHTYNHSFNNDSQGTIGTDLYYSLLASKNPSLPWADLKPEILIGRISVDETYEAQDRVDAIINYESSPPTAPSFYNTVSMAAQFQDGGTVTLLNKKTGATSSMVIPSDGIADRRFAQTTEDIATFLSSSPLKKTVNRLYWAETDTNPAKWNDNTQKLQEGSNFNGIYMKIGGNLPKYLLRSSGFGWNTQTMDITNAVNQGSFLVTHRDHGGRSRWSHPNFEIQDVGLLANKNLPPVVWSINCQTGWFDNETDFKQKSGLTDHTPVDAEAFSEYWERTLGAAISNDDYGAVGIVAGTRVTFSGYNDRFMMGMTDAIWPDYLGKYGSTKTIFEMAAVLYLGKAYMTSTTPNNIKEKIEHETLHWFGDPSMHIRTKEPPPMAILPTNNWPWALYPHDLRITVQKTVSDGLPGPVTDAKVTLKKSGTPELPDSESAPMSLGSPEHWVAYTDTDGHADFSELLLSSIGEYEIIASAANHLPAIATMESNSGPSGGILMDKPGYRCNEEVKINVADIDMGGSPTITVSLESGAGDVEEVELVNLGQGYFEGSIAISISIVDNMDGVIQTQNDDSLIATYEDDNDGTSNATITAEALMDCEAPVFDGLQSLDTTGGCPVELDWAEATESHSPLYYNVYRSESPGPLGDWIGYSSNTTYTDADCQLGQDLFYTVRAIDRLGNEDSNTIQLQNVE